jgi:hypothetical protein
MISLLGIYHSSQVYASKPINQGGLPHYDHRHVALEFEIYLRHFVKKYRPHTIIEEFNWPTFTGILKADHDAFLVAKMVCLEVGGITHKMLYSACHDDWLKQIHCLPQGNALLVCRANHIPHFQEKLAAQSIQHSVMYDNFSSSAAGWAE